MADKRWGPYVSERAWGTVREDYSAGGEAWDYVPHDHARSRTYRWNEDGLGGICDDQQSPQWLDSIIAMLAVVASVEVSAPPEVAARVAGMAERLSPHGRG